MLIGKKKRVRSSDDDDTVSVAKVSKTEMSPKGQCPCKSASIVYEAIIKMVMIQYLNCTESIYKYHVYNL